MSVCLPALLPHPQVSSQKGFTSWICQRVLPIVSSVFFCLLLTSSVSFGQTTPLTFDRVLELLKLEVKEEKLLSLLKEQPTVFTLSDDQLAQLKKAGASENLLAAMKSAIKTVVESDTGGYVMILDVSVSMLETVSDGKTKWDAAKKSAGDLISSIPDGLSLAVVVYGHDKSKPCEVEILRPLAPINSADKADVTKRIQQLQPSGNTPIGKSLQVAAEQVYKSRTPAKILLITDGLETCKGDPLAESAKFANSEVVSRTIDVIGFGLKSEEIASIAKIAENGKGKYFDAKNSQELTVAIEQAKQDLLQTLTKTEGAVKLPSSKDLSKPTELSIDTYTSARLSAGNSHYWQVTFPAGKYVLVYDVKSSDSRLISMDGRVQIGTDRDGQFVSETSVSAVTNSARERRTIEVEFSSPTTKIIQVHCDKGQSSLHDYHLGVFKKETKIGVPFLVNSPEVKELELGKETTSPQLGATPDFHLDKVVYYQVKLPAGDFIVDVQWTDGSDSDVPGTGSRSVWACDSYGVSTKTLLITADRQAKFKLQTADDQELILAFQAARRNEKITVKMSQVND